MLADDDMHRRQLLDLMARRVAVGHPLGLGEDVPAAAARRPVLDDLVERPRRQQRPALALMPRLGACLRPDGSLPRRGGVPGRSALGGCDELRDERLASRSRRAIRSSCWLTRFWSRAICSSIRNSTATTASRPRS